MNKGKIVQIIGHIIDVKFEEEIPNILNALEIYFDDKKNSCRSTSTFRK